MTGRPFPLLVADFSFDDDPRGVRAFSYDQEDRRHRPSSLPVGSLVWIRDLADPAGTETLAEIAEVEKDGWPLTPFWVCYLRPAEPPIRVADLAAAAGCTPEELLGGA